MIKLNNRQLNILKKVSYSFAILTYILSLFILFVIPSITGMNPDYFLTKLYNPFIYVILLLFTINLYFAIVNIIFLKRVDLLVLQIFPVLSISFFNAAFYEEGFFLVNYIKSFLKYFIPFPFLQYIL